MAQIKITNLSKSYRKGKSSIRVLDDISIEVQKGDFVALLGKSGSGKSSLLNILGLLDRGDTGEYYLNEQPVHQANETRMARLRNENIGFIFQSYHLLPFKNAAENVALPLYYRGKSFKERMTEAGRVLDLLEIGHRAKHYPNEMSGGECQRVAIGRALIGNPGLILADEPTGALDSATGGHIMNIFQQLNKEGITVILVTHDRDVAGKARSVYQMQDGNLLH